MSTKPCPGCRHQLRGTHFRDVTGAVICIVSEQRMSTGVIAPYMWHCDCVNYESPKETKRREGLRAQPAMSEPKNLPRWQGKALLQLRSLLQQALSA